MTDERRAAGEAERTGRALAAWLAEEPLRLRVLALVRAAGVPAYIVGGTVRDALLGRDSHDLDLAVAGDATALARRVADGLGLGFVPLDGEHDVARAVAWTAAGEEHFDFAGLRGADIDADLRARDFTLNAMAVPAEGPWECLLDPTGGRDDLALGVLRAAYPAAFTDDPLRILRGVRLGGGLGLCMEPNTEAWARAACAGLARVSAERVRDELLQILILPAAADLWRYGADLGALAAALPALGGVADVAALGARRLEALAEMEAGPAGGEPPAWADALAAYGREVLPGGFSRTALLRLAAVASALPGGAPAAQAVARGLRLSAPAVRQVAQAVREAGLNRERGPERWDARAVYRYYRAAGEGGVAGVALALAVQRAGGETPWTEGAATLWRAWFQERNAAVDPALLLSGADVMAHLGLTPGPRLGRLLEALREAQAAGEVADRTAALAWAGAWLAGEAAGNE